ncbi:unnamed protein product, partial [Polarella glacialis]
QQLHTRPAQAPELVAIFVNVLTPWLVFSGIFAAMSCSVHYKMAGVAWAIVGVGIILAGVAGFLANRTRLRERDPMWYIFAALALLIATVAAAVLGDMNFSYNMQTFYDIENLNSYPALYCVAPIVYGQEQLASYDFWAVGVNCCSGATSDFRYGVYDNPHARSGLRLLRDDQRSVFRLAVQQAEAAYNMKAAHPLFFYRMQDPVAEIMQCKNDGFRYYPRGLFTHFVFNRLCVACAVFGFSKLSNDL